MLRSRFLRVGGLPGFTLADTPFTALARTSTKVVGRARDKRPARVKSRAGTKDKMNKQSLLKLALISVALFGASAIARAESAFDEAPTPVRTLAPAYPEALRRDGVSGMVSVAVTVDENGNVTNASVAKSTNADFEQPALQAVAQWKFKPAKKAGQAVAVSVVLPVRFSAQ